MIFLKKICEKDFTTIPSLDTDTVLTVGTSTVNDTDLLHGLSRATFTKRANTKAVTIDTVDIGQSDIGNTAIDSGTIITNSKMRISKDQVLGRRDIKSITIKKKYHGTRMSKGHLKTTIK